MSSNVYRSCAVNKCQSSSKKTPRKLFIKVPTDTKMWKTWLKVASRDPNSLSLRTPLYFCEDHFDLENDMENYIRYKIMGSVKRIQMKRSCIPSRFDCQEDRKCKSTPQEPRQAFANRQKKTIIEEIDSTLIVKPSDSCNLDLLTMESPSPEATQALMSAPNRNEQELISTTVKDNTTTPSVKLYDGIKSKPLTSAQSTAKQKLHCLAEEKCDRDVYTPSLAGSRYGTSQYKLSQLSNSASDNNAQKALKTNQLNLLSTLSKIKKKPRSYIGVPKDLYFIIDMIQKHTKIPEQHILLCLMKIKLNRTFLQLADDFGVSVSEASYIFFKKLPVIVKVLTPFIEKKNATTIINNLPFAFRHKYYRVTSIIDCLEIEREKPKYAMHQALTWSDYKKANTIKYLLGCTPDGLVNFVSSGYGGRISDDRLVEHSKFVDSLVPGACILVNRGFQHLGPYLSQKGFTVLRPPNVAAEANLSKHEVQRLKQIGNLRSNVEQVIRRIREFGMLTVHSVTNSHSTGVLDLCVTTVCAINNMRNSFTK